MDLPSFLALLVANAQGTASHPCGLPLAEAFPCIRIFQDALDEVQRRDRQIIPNIIGYQRSVDVDFICDLTDRWMGSFSYFSHRLYSFQIWLTLLDRIYIAYQRGSTM